MKDLVVVWLGITGGEPLLQKHLPELIASAGSECAVKLFTSSCSLTHRLASELKDAGLFSVSVSLDHWDAAVHNRNRRYPRAYAEVLRAIEIFKGVGSLHVGVSTVRSWARLALDRFDIIAGNTGNLVYQLEGKTPWEQLIQTEKTLGTGLEGEKRRLFYERLLVERMVKVDYCKNLEAFDRKPRIFTLTLRGAGFSRVLQTDRVLYRSRHCPYTYQFYRVYTYQDRIAVFLNALTIGWEGDDVYKLIVTGVLDRSIPTPEPPERSSWE